MNNTEITVLIFTAAWVLINLWFFFIDKSWVGLDAIAGNGEAGE
jgi:hypothetical protein